MRLAASSGFWRSTAAICLLAVAPAANADQPAVLHMSNGDFIAGELRDNDDSEVWRWQHAAFTRPFEFQHQAVRSIQFAPLPKPPRPDGDYSIELVRGDVLFGSLVRMNEDELELKLPRFGLVHVQRGHVRRMLRWNDGAGVLYLGPNGLDTWSDSSTKPLWREEGGHLWTDQENAVLHGEFGLPAKATVEFEISWTQRPDFLLALGVTDEAKQIQQAFRFEVWDDALVAMRETDDAADVASLMKIAAGPGRVHMHAYLDQEQNRMFVLSKEGTQLAELQVSNSNPRSHAGLRLINKRGNVRLERLRIGPWNGEPPREVQADKSRLHRGDGSIVYGQITAFAPDSRELIVRNGEEVLRVPEADITSIILSAEGKEESSRAARAILHNGMQVSGNVLKVEGGQLWLASPSIRESLPFPLAELRSVLVLDPNLEAWSPEGRGGRLELADARIGGTLLDAQGDDQASCLVWRPRGSVTAAALRHGVSGKLVYRDPPPIVQVTRLSPTPAHKLRRPAGLLGGFVRAITNVDSSQLPATSSHEPSMHLRTGDTIPCAVQRIDERGVTFKTESSDATFVPHEKVKAVELLPRNEPSISMDDHKRERLLTLPRMQRSSPPTHLIRSHNGDYLRARLLEMDETTLTVEVRLEERQLPRQYVSRVIWLHEDELDPTLLPDGSEQVTRVQAVRGNGTRMTLQAQSLQDGTLAGVSEVLGTCRVSLNEIDRLLIGNAIEEAAAELAYQQWKLRNAPDPKFVTAGEGRSPGTESPLVGQPAPAFDLEMLGGETFRLSDHLGKIVVLDFWASWCGPCIQAMPQVEQVVHEFADQGVELFAVNLQESPEQITAALERLKLHPQVVLDIDGVVAERYAASAIPQTVIINREGIVARLFVGAGAQFAEHLREALVEVVSPGQDVSAGSE